MKINVSTLAIISSLVAAPQTYASELNLEFSGGIEVEGNYVKTEGEKSQSDIVVPSVELGIASQLSPWIHAEIVALYEEDTNNDGDFNIDTAQISIADPDSFWFVNAGQYTLPFGTYNSQMLSDPMTLEIGETADTALEVGVNWLAFNTSIYLFQGDKSDTIDSFGVSFDHQYRNNSISLTTHLGYLNDLSESNAIVDAGWLTEHEKVPAWIISTQLDFLDFSFIAEYLASVDEFSDAADTKPAIYNLELGYNFNITALPAVWAIGYQGSDDAEHDNWDIAETRLLSALSVDIFTGTSVGVEYKYEQNYARLDTQTVTVKLAYQF